MTTINIQFDDNKFWQFGATLALRNRSGYAEDEASQAPADWNAIQALAGPYKWSMAVKGSGQRKFHSRSTMTNSVWAMLENVKAELHNDSNAIIKLLTPDVEVLIGC